MQTAWAEHRGSLPDYLPPLPKAAVDAHEVLLSVVKECRARIAAKNLHVFTRLLSHDYHFNDSGDRMRQVYLSLINTAVAGAPVGGDITLRTSSPAHCALRLEIEEQSSHEAGSRMATGTARNATPPSIRRVLQ